jgi:hypothetical protein
MSHFAKAAEILRQARNGEAIPDPDEPFRTIPSPSRARSKGDPARLRDAYRTLWRYVGAYIETPTDEQLRQVTYQQDLCSQLEPVCAPAGSPWFRPALGKDETLFAKDRALDAQLHDLLALDRMSARWTLLARKIKTTIDSL